MSRRYLEANKIIYKTFRYLVFGMAMFYVFIFIVHAVSNIIYPYSLYWYEDESLYTVQRILNGDKIYIEPTADYISFIYPPLYYYLSAAVSLVTGPGFLPLRLVSFAASIGSLFMIYLYVFKQSRSKSSGLIAAGFYAGFYLFVKMWFDLARVDALAVFLILTSIYILKYYSSRAGFFAGGLSLLTACLTKQTAVIVFIITCLLHIKNKNLILYFMPPFLFLYLFTFFFFQRYHNGWYMYYFFNLSSRHTFNYFGALVFLGYDLMVGMPFGLVPILSAGGRRILLENRLLISAGLVYSLLGRMNYGGDSNSGLLFYAASAIVVGIILNELGKRLYRQSQSINLVIPLAFIFLLFFQMIWFAANIFNPVQYSFSKNEERKKAEKLISFIINSKGEVYLSNHRDLLRAAGKRGYAHLDALRELMSSYGSGEPTGAGVRIYLQMRDKVRNKEFALMIIDPARGSYSPINPLLEEMNVSYRKTGKFFELSGEKYYVYVPRD